MKKILFSLVALVCSMSMNAQVMKVMKNGEEVAKYKGADYTVVFEEEQEDGVTLTIAYPAQNTVDANYQLTGWKVGDEVTLYKATQGTPEDMMNMVDGEFPTITTPGVTFTCTNASTGEFSSSTMPDGETIDDYALAVYGGAASNYYDMRIQISPAKWYSENLEDVVTMVAWKDGEGKFTMKVINNVLKINNTTASDVEVAWFGAWANSVYYEGRTFWQGNDDFMNPKMDWLGASSNDCIWGWDNVAHVTLKAGEVTYLNFPMVTAYDVIGLKKENGDAVVTPKKIGAEATTPGHLFNVGEYSGAAL